MDRFRFNEKRLEGKVALVTGGVTALGKCIAKHYCKHEAKVVIVDIQDTPGMLLADELGPEISLFVRCDVSVETEVEIAVDAAVSSFGKLDPPQPSILDNDLADFERVIKVNLTGWFFGSKHAPRVMIPARKGSIISLGSVASSVGGVGTHAYTSAKHGVVGSLLTSARL